MNTTPINCVNKFVKTCFCVICCFVIFVFSHCLFYDLFSCMFTCFHVLHLFVSLCFSCFAYSHFGCCHVLNVCTFVDFANCVGAFRSESVHLSPIFLKGKPNKEHMRTCTTWKNKQLQHANMKSAARAEMETQPNTKNTKHKIQKLNKHEKIKRTKITKRATIHEK